MKEKYKDLTKNTLLFTISSFIPKIIGFILVPIYTSFLSTTDYGIFDLLNSTVYLLVPIVTLSIGNAVLRFTLDKRYEQKDCLNISMRIIVMDILILSLLTILQFTTHIVSVEDDIVLFFDALMILESFYDVFVSYCKGKEKVNIITLASIVNSLLTMSLNILFIVVLNIGLTGLLLANVIGISIADLICFIFGGIYKDLSKNFSKKQMRVMLKYSIPMVFGTTAWWINNASDRYIISLIAGVAISGIYAVASKIPAIIFMAQNVFSQAWSISAIKEYDENDGDGFVGRTFSLLSSILCIVCSLVIVLNIPLSTLLFKNDFFIAWKYVPLLSVSVAIDGLALFVGGLFFAVKNTKARATATIMGALVNTILNLVLIPVIGAFGAAIATVVGFLVGYVYSRIKIKKYIRIKTNFLLADASLILLIIQAILAYFGNQLIIVQVLVCISIFIINNKNILTLLSKVFIFFKRRVCSLKS